MLSSPPSDPAYPAYPILAILGAVMVLTPLPWHFQAWNAGTCLFMIWTAIACLNLAVNAIVWNNNALNVAPVWCDICAFLFLYFQALSLASDFYAV